MDIVTVIVGIVLLVSKQIRLNKERVLLPPRSRYAGGILIGLTVIQYVLNAKVSEDYQLIGTGVLFIVMFIMIFAFSTKQVPNVATAVVPGVTTGDKIINIITWSILGLLGLLALGGVYQYFVHAN